MWQLSGAVAMGRMETPLGLPADQGILTCDPEGERVREVGDTFSLLASGHSESIQSVATSPIRLSPLAMFLGENREKKR